MLKETGSALSTDAKQSRAQAKYAIGLGVFVLVVAALVFILYLHFSGDSSAYQAASRCASPDDAFQGTACKYSGQAKVLSTSRHDRLEAAVEFDSLPGRTLNTSFPTDNEPSSTALSVGATSEGEIWAGKVTRLAGKMTVDNPNLHSAEAYLWIAGGFVVGGLVILGLAAGLARQAWQVK